MDREIGEGKHKLFSLFLVLNARVRYYLLTSELFIYLLLCASVRIGVNQLLYAVINHLFFTADTGRLTQINADE